MKITHLLKPVFAVCALWVAASGDIRAVESEDADWLTGVRVLHDIPYGPDALQRFDVYMPECSTALPAPVIVMVHGGGWRRGDKTMSRTVENKVARWVPKGFIFISVNYRLLPDADPLTQAEDVAKALARAQLLAPTWGGEPTKFMLMGHSAGAHLVGLLNASPWRAYGLGARPWLGTVSLDSGAINVVEVMEGPHAPLYDDAFGTDPDYWRKVSPYHQLTAVAAPLLAVCSTARENEIRNTKQFILKARLMGLRAELLPEDLSHGEINDLLGLPGDYTAAVEKFMGSLDPLVRRRLAE